MNSIKKSRYISENIKKNVLQFQNYKCANNPNIPALNLNDYKCLLWICNDGNFDESGYDFDHIDEHSITSNNSISNIQALCPNCHRVKTKKFMRNKQLFTTRQMANGAELMDIDISIKKRKII
jgi:hypothetical protein